MGRGYVSYGINTDRKYTSYVKRQRLYKRSLTAWPTMVGYPILIISCTQMTKKTSRLIYVPLNPLLLQQIDRHSFLSLRPRQVQLEPLFKLETTKNIQMFLFSVGMRMIERSGRGGDYIWSLNFAKVPCCIHANKIKLITSETIVKRQLSK